MQAQPPLGVTIEQGPSDWQIFQQDSRGHCSFSVSGRWYGDAQAQTGNVELAIVDQNTGMPVNAALDWHRAEQTSPDGTWSTTIKSIPAGGLYRLETRFNARPECIGEWSARGDMRHFLGVGDLWVIAGQSNSAGYGRGPVHDPPELGIHLFRNNGSWSLAAHPMNESTDTRHAVNREHANPGHSPYLHFARIVKESLNHPIGLIQTALGGSPLVRWNPTETGTGEGAMKPDLYQNMLECVRAATTYAGSAAVKGILWYQGESDTPPEIAGTYGERFARAVGAWREALGNAPLPVITVQLNRVFAHTVIGSDRGWSQVREAQRQIPRRVPGVFVVPALDLPLSDIIHTSPAGNMLLADRMARAALGGVYGKSIDHRAPDLAAATAADDGKRIVLRFDAVRSRMMNIDPTARPFRVEDSAGEVPLEQVDYPGDATIQLTLGRPLSGPARVHGGYGISPPTMPVDIERMMPMLAFFDAPVSP